MAKRFLGGGTIDVNLDAGAIASGTLSTARVPSLDASKIASGTLNEARVPSLNASKIASGTLNADRVPGTINGVVLTHVAPAGSVTAFAGASAPAGWIFCNGSAVSRSTYAALFAAIGTAYGAGDGSTTFNLPDMRGVFARGAGTNGTANYGGRTGHTPAGGALATKGKQNTARNGLTASSESTGSHRHPMASGNTTSLGSNVYERSNLSNNTTNGVLTGYAGDHFHTINLGAGDTETAPASLSLNYIIKV